MNEQTRIADTEVMVDCPACGTPLGPVFYEVGPVPVHSCLMLDRAEDATSFPKGMVRLSLCEGCGFVANRSFDPKWSAYSPSYEDQQSFSPTFNSFAGALALGLVERHGLAGKTVVEVGCSKGDFLALLCEAGMADAIGIDPSAVEGRVAPPSRGRMRLIPDYYGPEHLEFAADLICCRHTLEHIQPVHETLTLMRRHAEKRPGAILCIEVPDATRLWKDCAFEDIYYEHCSYFTAGSLASAVRRAGFSVTDLRREYDGQYLVLEGCLDPSADRHFEIEETPAETARDVRAFQAAIDGTKSSWREAVEAERAKGHRIAIWGSGSKCVAFLRTLGIAQDIAAIIDINPHRTGKFAPSVSIPISSASEIADISPDVVIVMNPVYLAEIEAECRKYGVSPAFLTLGSGLETRGETA